MGAATIQKLKVAWLDGMYVAVGGRHIAVSLTSEEERQRNEGFPPVKHIDVPCYDEEMDMATFIERPGIRIARGTFPDDARVVYIFDTDDSGFGYAFNIDQPEHSEWGFAPVEWEEE